MTTGGDGLEARLEALRREGRQRDAARLARASGRPLRAAELLAEVWDHEGAAALALAAGRGDEAYRHALGALDRGLSDRVVARLAEDPAASARAAALADARGRPRDAARLREHAGDAEAAAVAYEAAGDLADAARLLEGLGRLREAGLRWERVLRLAPGDGAAALGLGRVLVAVRRPADAVPPLQIAARDPRTAGAADRLLVACLTALGLHHAAALALRRLRARDPALPGTVSAFLVESFGDARGVAAAPDDGGPWIAGRYRIQETLGAGATGRVVAARDVLLGRDVAVKLLTVGGGGAAGRDAYTRFAREARIAAAVDDPHVVRVLGFDPAGPHLVMERLVGGTLRDRLEAAGDRRPPLSPALVRRVAEAILRALDAVHRRGVVHRDLKPGNVLFDGAGHPKLGDFGVAHLVDLGTTLTGAMLGSLAYMAPEQTTGAARPTAATDLYAFGVVLFELLTGRLPFPGPDFVGQHLRDPAPAPSAVLPGIPQAFDALVRALLRKAPEARPGAAREVLDAVVGLPWDALPGPSAGAAPLVPAARADDEEEPPGPRFVPGPDGALEDRALGRRVEVRPCPDDASVAFYRALARADGPGLQAVWDVDEGRALVEHLTGEPPATPVGPEARAVLEAALRRLHAAGVVHGAVGPGAVVVDRGRVVLRLPRGPAPADATAEDDLRALAAWNDGP